MKANLFGAAISSTVAVALQSHLSAQNAPPEDINQTLQGIVNPARPYTPFDRTQLDRTAYNLRWYREIGVQKEDFLTLRLIFRTSIGAEPNTSLDSPAVTSSIRLYRQMAETGTIPEIADREKRRDELQQLINTGFAVTGVVLKKPKLIARLAVVFNAEEQLHDRYRKRLTTPEEIRRQGEDGLAVLRQLGAATSEDTLRQIFDYFHNNQEAMFGGTAMEEFEAGVAASFPTQAKVLPKLAAHAEDNLRLDPELNHLAGVLGEACDAHATGKYAGDVRTKVLTASLDAGNKVSAPLAEAHGTLVEQLKTLDAIVDERLRREEKARRLAVINEQTQTAEASLEALTLMIGVLDPEAAQAAKIVGSSAIKVGTSIALLSAGAINPVMGVSGLISGLFSLGSLFGGDDDAAVQRHIQVMRALERIESAVYEVHREIIEARKDIDWLHRDANRNFNLIHEQLSRIEMQLATGFSWTFDSLSTIKLGQLASAELLRDLEGDMRVVVDSTLETPAREKIEALRAQVQRLETGTATFTARNIEDGLLQISWYAQHAARGTYNVNGGKFAIRNISDDIGFERIQRREPDALTGLYGQIFSTRGIYRNSALGAPPALLDSLAPEEQLPSVGQLTEALAAYTDVLIRHHDTLAADQRPGEIPAYIKYLSELIADGEKLQRQLQNLADKRHLTDSLLTYRMGVYDYIVGVMNAAASMEPAGMVRVQDKAYVPFETFISDEKYWDGMRATVLPSRFTVAPSVDGIPEKARPFIFPLHRNLVTVDWYGAKLAELTVHKLESIQEFTHVMHEQAGDGEITINVAPWGLREHDVLFAANTWADAKFSFSREDKSVPKQSRQFLLSDRAVLLPKLGGDPIVLYDRTLDTNDIPLHKPDGLILIHPWYDYGTLAFSPPVIADAWAGDYKLEKAVYAKQRDDSIQALQKSKAEEERARDEARERLKKKIVGPAKNIVEKRLATAENRLSHIEKLEGGAKAACEMQWKGIDEMPSLAEHFAKLGKVTHHETNLASLSARNHAYAEERERDLCRTLFNDRASNDPEYATRTDRYAPISPQMQSAAETIDIGDYALDTMVRLYYPNATVARDVTVRSPYLRSVLLGNEDKQPRLGEGISLLVEHLDGISALDSIVKDAGMADRYGQSLGRTIERARQALQFAEHAREVREAALGSPP
ncbi:MAG: hypothetical protein H7Y88_01920 [Phycisphaerales bacterium]|nr:hypothetical protein [Phycisphaerales bacterium]